MNGYVAAGWRLTLACWFTCVTFLVAVGAAPPTEPKQHPLDPVISWAEHALEQVENIKDYTALLIKRERVNGRLQEYQYMKLKVRHEPFSVYIRFLKPASVEGREIIYVDGQNDGKLLAHETSGLGEVVGTVSLAPDGMIAMRGQRYPVTMIGIKNLGQKLIEEAKNDRRISPRCRVKAVDGAKVNGRSTRCIEVAHSTRHPEQRFSSARVFIDDDLGIPIRYEGYMWPDTSCGDQVLAEEYTYSDIQLNLGLTDRDFDSDNPDYSFK